MNRRHLHQQCDLALWSRSATGLYPQPHDGCICCSTLYCQCCKYASHNIFKKTIRANCPQSRKLAQAPSQTSVRTTTTCLLDVALSTGSSYTSTIPRRSRRHSKRSPRLSATRSSSFRMRQSQLMAKYCRKRRIVLFKLSVATFDVRAWQDGPRER